MSYLYTHFVSDPYVKDQKVTKRELHIFKQAVGKPNIV